jgi:uncharacterized membrane protein YfcA
VTIGSSIFLIALGAILRYAVTDAIDGVDLTTIGLILMVAGVVGLLIGLYLMTTRRDPEYRDPDYPHRRGPV